MSCLLKVEDLVIGLRQKNFPIVKGVSFELKQKEVLAIVGESGCGKSLTGLAILKLFPPGIKLYSGDVLLEGKSLYSLSESELRFVRGRRISMVFQDPLAALNPVIKVGEQVKEVLKVHFNLGNKDAKAKVLELLSTVGVPDAELRYDAYPHELSGGLRQRITIAAALAGNPQVLIADEPTTALDPTVRIQILWLLRKTVDEKGLSIIFISHDLGVVKAIADRVLIFYAGEVLEEGRVDDVFKNPIHPYTKALIEAYPTKDGKIRKVLTGWLNSGLEFKGCSFWLRCPQRCKRGKEDKPNLYQLEGRKVRCFLYEP